MTVPEIVTRLGGASVLAGGIGLPPDGRGALRVRAWKQRQVIPGQYWAAIVRYADQADLGVTLADLAAAHDPDRLAA